MLGLIIISAVAAQAPRPAPEPRWQAVSYDERGNTYIDLASLRRDGASFEARLIATIRTDPRAGPLTLLSLQRFDCALRTVALLESSVPGLDSGRSRRVTGESAAPRSAPAGTPGDLVLNRYCRH